jgi:hypothetical protein
MKLIDYPAQDIDSLLLLSDEGKANGYALATDGLNNITLLKEGKEMAWFSRLSDIDITQSLISLIMADEKIRKSKRLVFDDKTDE